jgi:hypothetical protein
MISFNIRQYNLSGWNSYYSVLILSPGNFYVMHTTKDTEDILQKGSVHTSH